MSKDNKGTGLFMRLASRGGSKKELSKAECQELKLEWDSITEDSITEDMYDQITTGNIFKKQTCRNCLHRRRIPLNEYSNKIIQCCELQKSRRSNSGFKTIKVTDKACPAYKETIELLNLKWKKKN